MAGRPWSLPFPSGAYNTVYADPPWCEAGGGRIRRGADRHYSLLRTSAICALGPEVQRLVGEHGHLYLWVTNNHLEDGLAVCRAWGFRYVTMITWAKDRKGLGQYFRGQTEHMLFGVRGRVPYRCSLDGRRAQGTTLIVAPRGRHSEKPIEARAMIEMVSWPPYIELFAREIVPGWSAWGDQLGVRSMPFLARGDGKRPVAIGEAAGAI